MSKKIEFINFRKDKNKNTGKIPNISIVTNPQQRKFSIKRFFFWFLLVFFLSLFISSLIESLSPKIGIIEISGVIDIKNNKGVSSDEIINILENLKSDTSIKAIVLNINTPGGSPVASNQISKKIEEVKKIKPVYSYINSISFSGGVWIMVSANKTYADELSLLGSIGVTSSGLGLEKFIEEYNITYRRQIAGKYKDIRSIFKKPTDEENKIIQDILDELHEKFIFHISKSRNLDVKKVREFSNGEIFLAEKGIEFGLIDKILTKEELIEKIKTDFDNDNLVIVKYGGKISLLEELGLSDLNLNFNLKNQDEKISFN